MIDLELKRAAYAHAHAHGAEVSGGGQDRVSRDLQVL